MAYEGICRCDCEARPIQLICGADGLFYRNACALECAGVPRGFNCGNQNTGSFNCQSCQNSFDPVCGVDGRNYGSPCSAQCVRVQVAYRGRCRSWLNN